MEKKHVYVCLCLILLCFIFVVPVSWTMSEKILSHDSTNPQSTGVNISEEWNKTWGSISSDRGGGIWVNGAYIYTCGYTYMNVNTNRMDMVVIKWDKDGNKIWNFTWGGEWDDEACGISGNATHLFICGSYTPSLGDSRLILMAWDLDGNVEWYRTYGTDACGKGISIFNSYIYTTGYIYMSGMSDQLLLIKWDLFGNLQWGQTWGGSATEFGRDVYATEDAIYAYGDTNSYGNGSYDCFLTKWDSDGNRQWNKTWGGGLSDLGLGVIVNSSAIYTSGLTQSYSTGSDDFYIIKWDEQGNILWNRTWGGTGSEECFSLCCNGPSLYAFGYTESGLSSANYAIAIWHENGTFINATNWGGAYSDMGAKICYNNSILYACGFTSSAGMGFEDLSVMKLNLQITPDPPAITLYSPTQGSWYLPGQEILCNVTDRSGTGLATVKYLWSTTTTSPDWTMQGDLWTTEPYSTTIPTGLVGFVYLHVNASDNAGLSTATYFAFRRDGENPSVVLDSPTEGGSYVPETAIYCSISDGTGVGLTTVLYNWSTSATPPDWAVDGVPWASPYELQVPYGPSGALYLHVNATDLLNNQNCTSFAFIRDGASPVIALDNATENAWYAPGTVIDCRVTPQGGASVTSIKYCWTTTITLPNWVVDGTSWMDPYHATVPLGTTGFLYLHVNATDSFGNTISSYFVFRRDGEAPVILLTSPAENSALMSGTVVNCSISDGSGSGIAFAKFYWSTTSNSPDWGTEGSLWSGDYNAQVPSGMVGQVFLHVYAIDAVGNEQTDCFAFNVEDGGDGGVPGFPLVELVSATLLGVAIVGLSRKRRLQVYK